MRTHAAVLTLGISAFAVQRLSALVPETVERLYSRGLFPVIARCLNLVSGLLPFSLAELTVGGLVLLFATCVAGTVRALRTSRTHRTRPVESGRAMARPDLLRQVLVQRGVILASFVSLVYAGFVVLWGLNYNRLSFSRLAGLETRPATVDDLAGLCGSLARTADYLRLQTKEDPHGVMSLNDNTPGALRRAHLGYERVSSIYPFLGGRYSLPKAVFISSLWSYTGISGMYWPFTGEANVNVAVPESSIPAAACHEMAHQRGFAREDEANYIAYLVCRLHPDVDFRYSGTLLALDHAMAQLRARDPRRYAAVRASYSEAVVRDLARVDAFWQAREGTIERFSDRVNDQYLKANQQSDGVLSYGRMVDLLLADYLAQEGAARPASNTGGSGGVAR
ncbi:MAG: DUF3810 domain-containing protein [Bacillota bacterium]